MDLGETEIGGVKTDAPLEDFFADIAAGQGDRVEGSGHVDDEEGEKVDARKVTGIA
jgi:hypothetical protein